MTLSWYLLSLNQFSYCLSEGLHLFNPTLKLIFDDPIFSSLLLRTIAESYYKGADIGECLSTAYRIRVSDFERWYKEWTKTAKRIHRLSERCMSEGHLKSVNEAYMRASNYYRTAGFLLVEHDDPRFHTSIENSKEYFRNAISTFSFKVDSIEIPYEGTTLLGYYYYNEKQNTEYQNMGNMGDAHQPGMEERIGKFEVPNSNNYPTLIVHGGLDSLLEELYSYAADPAIERGYNCLTFEGPVQGEVIRKQKIPFRHDWEKVVTPVLDFIVSRSKKFNVDLKRVALMGISMWVFGCKGRCI